MADMAGKARGKCPQWAEVQREELGPLSVSPHSLARGHLRPVETLGRGRGWFVGVKRQQGAPAEGLAGRSWPLLLDSDLAELVCLVSQAWPPR